MFGREFLNLVQIVRNHFFTQFGGEGRGCLPEEGGNVIRHRTTHAALEIYEERSTAIALTALNRCLFPHDIARLKVSVHKPYVLLLSPESAGKTFKIILQKYFVHRNFYRFEKAIFEVVQIKHDGAAVKLSRLETASVVKFFGPFDLHVCQRTNGF